MDETPTPRRACEVCGGGREAGDLDPCPGCAAPLHEDCLRYAGCSRCHATVELEGLRGVPALVPARPARRLAASLVDTGLLLLPGLAGLAAGLAAGAPALGVFALATAAATAAELLNKGLFQGEGGASLGKKLMGLRVLDRHGRPLGWRRALARDLIYKTGSTGALGLGFLGPLLDRDADTWHDRVSGCRVLAEEDAAPRALPPGGLEAGFRVRT